MSVHGQDGPIQRYYRYDITVYNYYACPIPLQILTMEYYRIVARSHIPGRFGTGTILQFPQVVVSVVSQLFSPSATNIAV